MVDQADDRTEQTNTPDIDTKLARLKQLGELRDAGVLTETEFEAKKAAVLAG